MANIVVLFGAEEIKLKAFSKNNNNNYDYCSFTPRKNFQRILQKQGLKFKLNTKVTSMYINVTVTSCFNDLLLHKSLTKCKMHRNDVKEFTPSNI